MNNSNPKHVSDFLEEQFNELVEGTAAPSELKGEVFHTLDTIGLLGDVVELFTLNFSKSEIILIDTITDGLEEDIKDSDSKE